MQCRAGLANGGKQAREGGANIGAEHQRDAGFQGNQTLRSKRDDDAQGRSGRLHDRRKNRANQNPQQWVGHRRHQIDERLIGP